MKLHHHGQSVLLISLFSLVTHPLHTPFGVADASFVPSNIMRQRTGGGLARSASLSTKNAYGHQRELHAAPKRLEENVDGVLYVNEKCINCAACSHFAPTVFSRSPSDRYHRVHKQPDPTNAKELDEARAALAACPVAAIRVENSASLQHKNMAKLSSNEEELAKKLAINPKLNGLDLPFPRPLVPAAGINNNNDDNTKTTNDNNAVYFTGHHNDKSFGATPYLVRGTSHTGQPVWVMVDTPKFTPSAIRAVVSLTGPSGPDYLFLTHVDDTAHHNKWVAEFPGLKRIFHDGDLGRHNWLGDATLEDVEVLLHGRTSDAHDDDSKDDDEKARKSLKAWNLDGADVPLNENNGDFVILHTPGHSPGSISLLFQPSSMPGILFTGDTYAYSTRDGGGMSGFPRYGNDLSEQSRTLRKLLALSDRWDVIAPGHGHHRDYTSIEGGREAKRAVKESEMEKAVDNLVGYRRRWR